ncbi:hypothetical protein DY000_02007947 [Brassica cretica]|uniref:Pectinesterase inhibitor domain-containing protein n=1 Tax=Brassica cretica TaxID=69181 RepID=A0ABQ7C027_BRACR|nr:hypothetical protein DY000_02007947 [Brassica cretica]
MLQLVTAAVMIPLSFTTSSLLESHYNRFSHPVVKICFSDSNNHATFSAAKTIVEQRQAAATIMSSCFEGWPSATSLPKAVQAEQATNNLLGTHDLNTRLRVGNSLTRVYKNSPLARHEFTETLLLLGTSSQYTRLCLSVSPVNSSFAKHEFKANSPFTRHKFKGLDQGSHISGVNCPPP